MNYVTRSVACLVVGGASVLSVGCGKDEPMADKPAMKSPTTKPMTATTAPTTKPAEAAAAGTMMKESDMTHVCDTDTPVFGTMASANIGKPEGMLKKGEKVIVMMPRGKFAQVTTVGGQKGYVATAALKPLGK